jgi:hypothetical protein
MHMKRHRIWLTAVAATLAISGVRADPPSPAPETVILFREPGKPDRKCVIERSTPQADGTILHDVRDAATGEKFRVTDSRRHKGLFGSTTNAEPPVANTPLPRRIPTTAELAGYSSPLGMPVETGSSFTGVFRRTKPAAVTPVQAQVQKLKDAPSPTDREMAAMTLTLGDARATAEVIDALTAAAKSDPTASVRVCLVRCLYRLGAEAPQVVPVIQQMQADADDEVSRTAQLAMQELGKK